MDREVEDCDYYPPMKLREGNIFTGVCLPCDHSYDAPSLYSPTLTPSVLGHLIRDI